MEKINIAELLIDCPKGMELDCINYNGVVTFEEIFNCPDYPIKISVKYDNEYFTHTLTKYGQTCKSPYNKCIIFPKGKTTWEGFHRPFKDGDIVFYDNCVSIFKEWGDETLFRNYVKVDIDGRHPMLCDRTHSNGKGIKREARFATEEEKAELFNAIKANGYKWNPETKTLEKLISNRFDINTLKPFESKVLIRNDESQYWIPAFWGCKRTDGYTTTFGWCKYCIPYEGNEHLLETNDDCDEHFKTWK